MQTTKWIVITGGPSSGITSLGNYLRLLGFRVVPECARALIDLGRSCGVSTETLREDQVQFERDIVEIQYQIEKRLPKENLIFIERGLLDCEAYGMPREEILKKHLFRYDKIFVLNQVGFEHDYARTEDKDEALQLEKMIVKAYHENGYETVHLKKKSIMKRAQKMLDILHLKAPVPIEPTINDLLDDASGH